MNVQMPTMNGIDAARVIREKLGAKCPVIFALTAEALEGDKKRFLGLGFDGYLSKPLQTHTLQETLRTIQLQAGARKGVGVEDFPENGIKSGVRQRAKSCPNCLLKPNE